MLRTSLPAGRAAGLPRGARRTLLPSPRRVVARAMDLREAVRVLQLEKNPRWRSWSPERSTPPLSEVIVDATFDAILNGVDHKQVCARAPT